MKPGMTVMPFASMVRAPAGALDAVGPTDAMRPPFTTTAPFSSTVPLPTMTRALVMTRSWASASVAPPASRRAAVMKVRRVLMGPTS
jgi:hypothetical protein